MCYYNKNQDQQGFTLIEISILLVIIGLIIGGIMVGQVLVRNARVQAVAGQLSQYQTAINSFLIKYDALPGDIVNAYNYWGAGEGSCTNAHSDIGAGAGCNGNGDGIITYADGTIGPTAGESSRLWQHLALAKMIPGSFSGTDLADVPQVKGLKDTGISMHYRTSAGINTNILEVAAAGNGAVFPSRVLFTPAEAYKIDIKMDDGVPHKGSLYGWGGRITGGVSTDCLSGGNVYVGPETSTNVSYDIAVETPECRLLARYN